MKPERQRQKERHMSEQRTNVSPIGGLAAASAAISALAEPDAVGLWGVPAAPVSPSPITVIDARPVSPARTPSLVASAESLGADGVAERER
jgi:hypothetical protein